MHIAYKNILESIESKPSAKLPRIFHEIMISAKLETTKESDKFVVDYISEYKSMLIMVLDTGNQKKSFTQKYSSLSKIMCREFSDYIKGEYQAKSFNHPDIKNIQKCSLRYIQVEFPSKLSTTYTGEVYSANKFVLRSLKNLRRYFNFEQSKYYNYYINVLIFDTDTFLSHQMGNSFEIVGWKSHFLYSLEELFKFKELNSINLVVIDGSVNRRMLSTTRVDIAKCIRLMGYPFAIVGLTNSLGEKPSSPYFTDSLSKPIIDNSIEKLKKITLNSFLSVILSMEKN